MVRAFMFGVMRRGQLRKHALLREFWRYRRLSEQPWSAGPFSPWYWPFLSAEFACHLFSLASGALMRLQVLSPFHSGDFASSYGKLLSERPNYNNQNVCYSLPDKNKQSNDEIHVAS